MSEVVAVPEKAVPEKADTEKAPKPPKKQRAPGSDGRATRLWTGFVGGLVEAWAEVRVHRTQVLLSLIGVVVAVTTLTGVVAAGAIATQSSTESLERSGGRPATLYVGAFNPTTGASPTRAAMDLAFAEVMKRYGITYTSRTNYGGLSFQFPDGVAGAQVMGIDQPFAAMHRIGMAQGSWFTAADTQRLAPAIVVSEEIWNRLGSPALSSHPTIQIVLPTGDVTAVIIGITPAQSPDGSFLSAFLLNDNYDKFVAQDPNFPTLPNYEAWVPPAASDALLQAVQRDMAAQLGQDWEVNVSRQDYLAYQTDDPLFLLKVIVIGMIFSFIQTVVQSRWIFWPGCRRCGRRWSPAR